MPCLVIFKLPQNPNSSFEAWDIIEVLPAQQHPGVAVAEEPWRFGFNRDFAITQGPECQRGNAVS